MVCGAILNIAVILAILLFIISIPLSKMDTKKAVKKRKEEEAKRQEEYKKELEEIKPEWLRWAKEVEKLKQARSQETDPRKRLRLSVDISECYLESRFFYSISKVIPLHELGQKNGWKLEETGQAQTEEQSC